MKLLDGGLQIAGNPSLDASRSNRRRSGHSARAARRGISLLEVLISMFVMLVGVVSVFSLIALGRFEMLEGSKADRGMSLARSGQREMLARGFLRPLQLDSSTNLYLPMWLNPAGASLWGPFAPTANQWGTMSTTNPEWPPGTIPSLPFAANAVGSPMIYPYAIDPLGVAANSTSASPSVPSVPNAAVATVLNCFPAYYNNTTFTAPATPMTRITLRAAPFCSGGASPVLFFQMTVAEADAIFRSQDDVVLNPVVGNFPPTQGFSLASGNPTRRQSNGDYSWMATVVPTQGDTKMCLVSIVVFYKRNFILPGGTPVTDPTTPPPERMVNLTAATNSSGLGGGDVLISCPTTLPSDYIKVRPGQWILLSQTPAAPGFWRWYRVVATSDPVLNSGNWVRQVTLAGPDWNPSAAQAFASIFDGVIGVYERNIELEESGALWSPN